MGRKERESRRALVASYLSSSSHVHVNITPPKQTQAGRHSALRRRSFRSCEPMTLVPRQRPSYSQ